LIVPSSVAATGTALLSITSVVRDVCVLARQSSLPALPKLPLTCALALQAGARRLRPVNRRSELPERVQIRKRLNTKTTTAVR
jgi:hypothetical protein